MRSLCSFFRSLMEDVVGTENRFLMFAWCLAVVLVLGFGFVLNSETVSIQAVAESREYQINFDTAVEIKQIHVLPSQIVKKGDLLLELGQKDLESQRRVLRSRYDRLLAELKLRQQISRLTKDFSAMPAEADPLQVELSDTKREIELIENRLRNLFVFAEIDGAVGAVNFKNGEKAPAFAPLLTLVPLNPSYVNGYINENLHSSISVGQIVDVISASGHRVQGRVASVGSRIVPIPDRLLRIQTLSAWGREVVVKIPASNEFLVGEKVSVKRTWGISLFSTAQALQGEGKEEVLQTVENINFPSRIAEAFIPEISGIAYLPEIRQFALISDDYPEDRPMILLMNSRGEVAEQMLPIEGLEKMEDIESISIDQGAIYLLSSLSASKKGKLREGRELFVKVARNGIKFILEKQINLRRVLLEALEQSANPLLRKVYIQSTNSKHDDLEIEGHFVKDGDLYLALKRPILKPGEGLILKVEQVERLFLKGKLDPNKLSVAIQFEFDFPRKKHDYYLSDMIYSNEQIYISTSCIHEKCSAIWKIHSQEKRAELVQEFNVQKLEGISLGPSANQIFGVFDSKKNSQFITIPFTAAQRTE